MHYVMSDLHGRYDLFLRMLEKISFSDCDTLYLLGDLIDRGPDGIKLIQETGATRITPPHPLLLLMVSAIKLTTLSGLLRR